MFIHSFKINFKLIILMLITIIVLSSIFIFYSFATETSQNTNSNNKNFIKWVDFNVSYDALDLTAKLDIKSHTENSNPTYNWIELLAYLACQNGGDFKEFTKSDLDNLTKKLENGETMENLSKKLKLYNYYYESYSAVLSQFIGTYYTIDSNGNTVEKYGIKAFSPIAKNYYFSHSNDFGNSRSYGFKRVHLGNDLLGSIGTPIVAVESGTIEHLGWNQYGGWRIGIRSFDSKRYYYYAHLRKDHPYADGLSEGMTVQAGSLIGYMGMTGYSIKENVNNVNIPHLHFGMQLIFDDSQVDSPNEIWIDVYQIVEFLKQNTAEVKK